MERGSVPRPWAVLDLSKSSDWLVYMGLDGVSTEFVVIANDPGEQEWVHRKLRVKELSPGGMYNPSGRVLSFPLGSMVYLEAIEV